MDDIYVAIKSLAAMSLQGFAHAKVAQLARNAQNNKATTL